MHSLASYLDPRRSLALAIGWLVFALSTGLVLVASVWVDGIVGANLLDLRGRQLDRAADDIVDELNLSFALRLQSVRALAAILATELRDENQATLHKIITNLQRVSPEFESIVVANPRGRVLAAAGGAAEGPSVADRAWFAQGLQGSKRIRDVQVIPMAANKSPGTADDARGFFVRLMAPVNDTGKDTVGVIGIRLSKRWLLDLAGNLGERLRDEAGTAALLLDQDGTVLIGASGITGRRLASTVEPGHAAGSTMAIKVPEAGDEWHSHVERLADGRLYLVARATPAASADLRALGWRVVVLQPLQDATHAAGMLQRKITGILLGLGLFAALIGVLLARRLTRNLETITRSADAVRAGATHQIAVPPGQDEATRLGYALDQLLTSLQRERSSLQTLNAELDQRVTARTREIERLAEQARYAAVVRERLTLARDLHDTLAHSMMEILTEIRILKRLAATNPAALAEELARAEETAHQGLQEARAAITRMRFNPVRDAGLAAALDELVRMFVERTGIVVEYASDAPAGTFADERAEALFPIAEETLRNIEHHAGATRVTVALRVSNGGDGLTLTIADDGAGFDVQAAHPGHYGLAGLREQAQLIGAVLTMHSAPRQGTTITVALAPGS